MSAGSDPEKAEWLTVLRECVESAQSGNTPVSLLLKQLGRDNSELTIARERLQTMQRDVRRTTRKELADEDRAEETAQRSESECSYNNVAFNLQKDKFKTMDKVLKHRQKHAVIECITELGVRILLEVSSLLCQ